MTVTRTSNGLGIAWQMASVFYAVGLALALTLDMVVSENPPVSWMLYGVLMGAGLLQVAAVYAVRLARTRLEALGSSRTEAVTLVLLLPYAGWQVYALHGLDSAYWSLLIVPCLVAGLALKTSHAILLGLLAGAELVLASAAAGSAGADRIGSLAWAVTSLLMVTVIANVVGGQLRRLQQEATAQHFELEQRVQELSTQLTLAANGDLDVDFSGDGRFAGLDELGEAFGQTLSHLRGLVAQVRGGGEQIAASAGQMLSSAEEHAVSATQQSSAVTETTSTIEELAATAAQIAETAAAVSRYAAETLRFAEDGRSAVMASVYSMDQISDRVDSIASRALSLGAKSQEIGKILEVIDDLADQTNLLALNAAIEAARAGEHGRGFAVVASEVRKLAERAQESTGQIQAIISEIQAETNSTIMASEEGAKEVRNGTELAQGVVDALERIAGMVDETTTAAKEISIATQQQRSASDQVVSAMTQVSDVARSYAVGSQQSAAAAAQLNELAAELRSSIEQFSAA